jgi:hypothetical protein
MIYYLRNQRRDILILFCPFVEGLIVLDRSKFLVFLTNIEEVGTIWGLRYLDRSSFKVFFDDLPRFLMFFLCEQE